MNLHDMHSGTDDSHTTTTGHPVISIVLYALSWLFIYLESFTADEIWTWIFRGLSLVSLSLIIFINWNKAREILKGDKIKRQD